MKKVLKCKINHQTGEYTCVSGKKFNIRGNVLFHKRANKED